MPFSSKVGYCNPPKHSQFKPGQSGNLKGRPKDSLNMRTIFERAIRQCVSIKEKGRNRRVKKMEVAFTQLSNRAASGNLAAIALLAKIAAAVLPQPSQQDLKEVEVYREQNRDLSTLSFEELQARRQELREAKASIRRVERKERLRKKAESQPV